MPLSVRIGRDSNSLSRAANRRRGVGRDSGPHIRRIAVAAAVWAAVSAAPAAAGEPAAGTNGAPPTEARLASTANLDGVYIALGPVAEALYIEDEWDGGWGGEIAVVRVRERAWLSAVGGAIGGIDYADRSGGRFWADAVLGTRRALPWSLALGIAAGPTVELDDTQHPRWGAQGSLWLYAGVQPYVRVAALQEVGVVVDFGVKIPLPALRF